MSEFNLYHKLFLLADLPEPHSQILTSFFTLLLIASLIIKKELLTLNNI